MQEDFFSLVVFFCMFVVKLLFPSGCLYYFVSNIYPAYCVWKFALLFLQLIHCCNLTVIQRELVKKSIRISVMNALPLCIELLFLSGSTQ